MPEPKNKPFFKILKEKAIEQKHFKILKEGKYDAGSNRPKFSALKSIKRGLRRFPQAAALLGAYEGGKWIYKKIKGKKKAKGGIIRDSFKQQYD